MKKDKELAVKAETTTAIDRPVRRGFEGGVDSEDLIIPRAMLIQNTPPKTVTIDKKICPPGTVINNLTALPLKTDERGGIFFIPVIVGRKWIRFNAVERSLADGTPNPLFNSDFEEGAKIWESRDPRDPRVIEEGAWGKDGEKPLATKILEFLCIVEGEEMPLVLSFSKTSFKAGKQLVSMAQYSGKDDLFSMKYRLQAKEEKNDKKQEFYSLAVSKVGPVTDEEFRHAEDLYESFSGKDIKIHGEEEETDPVSAKQPWE